MAGRFLSVGTRDSGVCGVFDRCGYFFLVINLDSVGAANLFCNPHFFRFILVKQTSTDLLTLTFLEL